MGDEPVCRDCMLPLDEYGCGCALRCGDEITGRLTPIPGMDHRFRIGQSCGDTFQEEDDFDGITLTVEVDSLEQGEAFVRALRSSAEGREDALRAAVERLREALREIRRQFGDTPHGHMADVIAREALGDLDT